MPYIEIKLSHAVSEEKKEELKSTAGRLIEIIPEKTEQKLMIRIEDDANMYFRGVKEKCAYVSVSLYMTTPYVKKGEFARAFVKAVSEITDTDVSNIFMSFSEYNSWVLNGDIK